MSLLCVLCRSFIILQSEEDKDNSPKFSGESKVQWSFLEYIFFGSFYVSWKLPTYPFLKQAFCPKWEVSVNIGLGEG